MEYTIKNYFNPTSPQVMHVDINSCFASVEQQYNVSYRNKPLAVAPNYGDNGTIVAASYEAKKLGIKTGFKVFEAKKIYPNIIIIQPHIELYKEVHIKLKRIIQNYCPVTIPKSIDEFTADFTTMYEKYDESKMIEIANKIKSDIKQNIGDYVTVSIGIGPNAFLAKTASDIKKPNGLEIINSKNYLNVYENLKLTDLCGISKGNEARLNSINIYKVLDFYNISYQQLHSGLKSITAYFWYMRLRGWEVDDISTHRGSFSQSYMLKENIYTLNDLKPILSKLVVKLTSRLRESGYAAKGLIIQIRYIGNKQIVKKHHGSDELFDTIEIYNQYLKIISKDFLNNLKVKQVYIAVFDLKQYECLQLNLLTNVNKTAALYKAIDEINKKWGKETLIPGISQSAKSAAPDAIAFGKSY